MKPSEVKVGDKFWFGSEQHGSQVVCSGAGWPSEVWSFAFSDHRRFFAGPELLKTLFEVGAIVPLNSRDIDNSQFGIAFSIMPNGWITTEVFDAWKLYESHRKGLKVKAYSNAGIQLLAKRIKDSGMTSSEFIALIEEVISRNWQGIPVNSIKKLRHETITVTERTKEQAH